MSRTLFNKLYRQLNPNQRLAVVTIEGPVFVLAGPGTGKTQVLTLRLANILLQTDTPADALLALTFTRSGVFSMRERLRQIIGPEAYRVGIYTFHGFCQRVIKDYPDEFSRLIGATPATLLDELKLWREVLARGRFKLLRPAGNPDHYLLSLRAEIGRLKRENLAPAELKKMLAGDRVELQSSVERYHQTGRYAGRPKRAYLERERRLEKNQELARAYGLYETALRESKLYDFGDMVMEVVRRLRQNSRLLAELQETYHYLLADEHQDANQSQNELLERLAAFHDSPNLFIVGDEKQAIFQFQGASLDNFNYFKRRWPQAHLIALEQNYRSTQSLLDAAWSLMSRSEQLSSAAHPRLLAQGKQPASLPLQIAAWPRPEDESSYLAEVIKRKLRDGVTAESVAVIYRNNRDRLPIIDAFERARVPYVVATEEDILNDPLVTRLLNLFRAVVSPERDENLAPLLFLDCLRTPVANVALLLHQARAANQPLWAALAASTDAVLQPLARRLADWQQGALEWPLEEAFERLLRDSGLLAQILARPDAQRQLPKLERLFQQAKNLRAAKPVFGLADFVSYLDLLRSQGLPIESSSLAPGRGVCLLTAHRSKGLEFDWVFIVGAHDGHWGGQRGRRAFFLPLRGREVEEKTVEDERRLFYVALTRARRGVTVSYPSRNERGDELLPSRFIEEIDPHLVQRLETAEWEKRSTRPLRRSWSRPRLMPRLPLNDRAYLRELFQRRGFSVTGLNNYLECPWRFFFQNLLRLPAARSPHLVYGEAVHAALHQFFERRRRDEAPSRRSLLTGFAQALSAGRLASGDEARWRERGTRALGGYYDAYRRTWRPPLYNELGIYGIELAPGLRLTGKIDKIETLASGEWRVVDYKTGRPKARSEVYRRQLLFYKLLLDRYFRSRPPIAELMLDFIEPTPAGRYRQEVLSPTAEQVEELVEMIKTTAAEILSLKFWSKRCKDEHCDFCRLRETMSSLDD